VSQLGDFVRSRREDVLRLSQLDLGKLCGLSAAYIHQIETGINPSTGRGFSPKVDTLRKLAKGLGSPYETLDRLARGLPIDQADEAAKVAEIMELLRQVPPDRMEAAMRMLRSLAE
jgi:transcriptional regulator with XRE-family HTH domain